MVAPAIMSELRFHLFMELYGNAETWPREGAQKHLAYAPPDANGARKMIHFDGYSYLQSVASYFCAHRKNRTSMGLTDVQLAKLRALPWMDNYLNHLQKYHEKYGSRDKHPTTEQKLVMFAQLTKKPTKDDRFHITDKSLLPSGVESYDFDARRFMDAITYNWKVAWKIPVKRIPIELSDERMDELIKMPWFYDFVFKMLRKHTKIKHGDSLLVSRNEVSTHEEICKRLLAQDSDDHSSSDEDDGILLFTPTASPTKPCNACQPKVVGIKRPLEACDLPAHEC